MGMVWRRRSQRLAWPRPAGFLAALTLLGAVGARLVFGGTAATLARLEVGGQAAQRVFAEDRLRLTLGSWAHFSSPHFVTYYGPGLADMAHLVTAIAARDYPRIFADFALPVSGPRQLLVVVSPAEMARYVGGPSANPPLGAYYDGAVWLLAPTAFLRPGPHLGARYAATGPTAHELTHLADALVSGGRTPVWLDEGLAQYEDWRLTGYVWQGPDSGFSGPVYSWAQITDHFAQLPNQARAYRQALAATASICRRGRGVCLHILQALRRGVAWPEAIQAATGRPALRSLEAGAAWRPGSAPRSGASAGPAP